MLLGLAVATVLAGVTPQAWNNDALVAAARSAVRSAADLIRARSPGLRSGAELVKTKRIAQAAPATVRAAHRARKPAAVIAAPVVPTPPPSAIPLVFDSPPLAPAFVVPDEGPMPAFAARSDSPCCLIGFNPPMTTVGGGFVFGPGGGGTVPTPGGENPPPAIPEPSSWGMMILGFALFGAAWRRRRRLLAQLWRIPLLFHARVRLLAYVAAK